MTTHFTEQELAHRIQACLVRANVAHHTAKAIAKAIVAAERDGTYSHGLLRLPGYLDTLKSGWVDGQAQSEISDIAPGAVLADARNGFAQAALEAARPLLMEKARQNGVATLAIRNSHHFGCLWADVEPFAEEGFVAIAFLNSRSRIVAPGATTKVLGTNPMAFATPRADGPPLVWDQASSTMAHGDVIIAAVEGTELKSEYAVDREGSPTTDPAAVLDGGALLPFGGHKGLLIALMIETLAAACTGSRFGFEDESANYPGAQTSNAGQMVVLIDPDRLGASGFTERVEQLLQVLVSSGVKRLPGQKRYAQREASRLMGIPVSDRYLSLLDV